MKTTVRWALEQSLTRGENARVASIGVVGLIASAERGTVVTTHSSRLWEAGFKSHGPRTTSNEIGRHVGILIFRADGQQ